MSKCVNCGSEILTGDIHWEMGLCNNCYNELYKDHKTHISLDKMWLKLAQSFRDENEKLQDKVADLEAKLAESEKNYKDARELGIEQFHSLKEIINFSQEEIDKLKQQLDEKEKELSEYVKIVDDLHKQLSDKCDFCDKTKDQDKILFAVDILEELADCSNYINSKLDFESGSYVSEKSIRDKIKYLKGNKYE